MQQQKARLIAFIIAALLVGALIGWCIAEFIDEYPDFLKSTFFTSWLTAAGTFSAVIVALGLGVITHRREVQLSEISKLERLNRASAIAVPFDHELHVALSMAKAVREEISEAAIKANIDGLVFFVNEGVLKIDIPLIKSFSRSLSDFEPNVSASLLVVLSRYLQMKSNGPIPSEDMPDEFKARALRNMHRLLDRWVGDIEDARSKILPYHQRIADIEAPEIDLKGIIGAQNQNVK